ncbi:MAG: LysR family transcriptional regulator [Byssovorax sp.]
MIKRAAAADYETLVGDVHDLRAFALAVDLRSFTAASRLMGESKATVSRRIARLEAALGVSLLRRTPRAVEPTDDGVAYRVRVAEILELLGDANAAVRNAHAAPSGQLRVTAPPGFEGVLAPPIAEFAREFPAVIVNVLITERFVDLEAEHIDVALRAATRLPDSSLVAHRLVDFEMITVAAPAYVKKHGAPRRAEDLAAHRIVQLRQAMTASTLVLRKADGTGEPTEVRLAYSIAATDVGFARELVVAAAGIAVLPRMVVQRDLDEGRLVHLLRPYMAPGAALYFLHRQGRFLPPKIRAFRDWMTREFPAKCKKQPRGTTSP